MYSIVYRDGTKLGDADVTTTREALATWPGDWHCTGALGDERKFTDPAQPGTALYVRPDRAGIHTEDTETDTDTWIVWRHDTGRHAILAFNGHTATTPCGTAHLGLCTDPIRPGDLVMVFNHHAHTYRFTDTAADVGRDGVRLTGEREWTPRRDVARIYPYDGTIPQPGEWRRELPDGRRERYSDSFMADMLAAPHEPGCNRLRLRDAYTVDVIGSLSGAVVDSYDYYPAGK